MSGPTVFISYSHKDEIWKDLLVRQLRVLELEGAFVLWDDRKIAAGDGWRSEIETVMESARAAVLLISADFLISDFIRGTEVPRLLRRREKDGLRIIPLIVHPCPWRRVPWLAEIQGRPTDGRPLAEGSPVQIEKDLCALAEEIADLLQGVKVPPLPGGREGGWERGLGGEGLDLGRLPIPGPHFLGRDAYLAHLDAAWDDPKIHILTLVAFGGVGKSALVAHWLDHMSAAGWRGAARVLDWSFYSHGTEDRVTSAEPFIDHALRFFGDPDPKAGSLYDRGARLAHLIRKERTLLVLDGVEPLQYPPGRPEIEGRLKDPGLTALLKGLAAGNPGLCVVTTRERIADLAGSKTTAPQIPLEELEPGAAVELLCQLGVDGRESELRAAAEDFKHHALTLTLLGNFLRRAHGGDVRKRKEIDLHRADETQGGHAFRVIAAYARWLGEGPELAILRLLGLFDRPADAASLKALRAAPPIPGLTELLVDLSNEDWRLAVSTLRDHSLLAAADPQKPVNLPETLDAHPLVRACFAEELESHRLAAWQEGNRRLYEHLRQTAPDLPDTLEAMQPLYAAVVHGCRAGRQQEVMDEVSKRRIWRNEAFSVKQLGAFGSELTALAGFFDRPWSKPSSHLAEVDQSFVLNAAAFVLRALGRLAEAVEPMQASLEAHIAQESWGNAAQGAENLSELALTLGNVPRAVAFGDQSVELADRSGDAFHRISKRTSWADALHQAGRWEESAAAFREAEAMQAQWQPEYPRLYSLPGFRYRDLLLGRAEPEDGAGLDGLAGPCSRPEEAERFRQVCQEVLEWAKSLPSDPLLDIALDHLSLGRAHLGLALLTTGDDRAAGLAQAAEILDRAVDGLRRAGQEDDLPRGLLGRAALRRFNSDFTRAAADLTEALEIAERGPMRLHECDAHLECTRLCRDQGDVAAARQHVARARELVKETGYGRREREVGWLERTLA
ncbi:MAG TPA: toll/interleukin-1 receptor domain-containing protein [Thermoanaerobaculia bacterium]|nr:toll/interleukin-1 receptor domain-containing protein [Thermoanaerobaculia bacterium]